jgi:hypothetical protein
MVRRSGLRAETVPAGARKSKGASKPDSQLIKLDDLPPAQQMVCTYRA